MSSGKEFSKLNDRLCGELGALRQVVDSQWAAQMNLRQELVHAVLYERETRAAEVHELRQTLETFAKHVANILPQRLAAVGIITRLESVINGGETPKSLPRSFT
jgi:D-serine dehydratase